MDLKNKTIPELCNLYSHEKSKEYRAKEQVTRILEEIQRKNRGEILLADKPLEFTKGAIILDDPKYVDLSLTCQTKDTRVQKTMDQMSEEVLDTYNEAMSIPKTIPEILKKGMKFRLKTKEEAKEAGWYWDDAHLAFSHSDTTVGFTEEMFGVYGKITTEDGHAETDTGHWFIIPEMIAEIL